MTYYRDEVYKREDGLFDWRMIAPNGEIVSTSGGQGYTERNDAQEAIDKIIRILNNEGVLEEQPLDPRNLEP